MLKALYVDFKMKNKILPIPVLLTVLCVSACNWRQFVLDLSYLLISFLLGLAGLVLLVTGLVAMIFDLWERATSQGSVSAETTSISTRVQSFFSSLINRSTNKPIANARLKTRSSPERKIEPQMNKAPNRINQIRTEAGKKIKTEGNGRWLVVGASIAGRAHTESVPPVPCQDSYYYKELGDGWGIAVTCDGAGSVNASQRGAEFVAEKAGIYFEQIIKENDWKNSKSLPNEGLWHKAAKIAFAKIRHDLERFAEAWNLEARELACTVIVVVFSPLGIMASHIGDGRAGFCNGDNEWKAVIEPWKGEEANQTAFITTVDWNTPDKYIESRVFAEKPIAFTLMSDGCEQHAFECLIYNTETQKYISVNKPYPKFFNPLVELLKDFYDQKLPKEEINNKWRQFIKSGNEGLKNEPDDKTMILGILVE